ncbi:MAG TPA: hypothetical protein VFD51_00750 [Patescibacteria group bacterium]|nr:hypothetical protein [Patescibacteria group bacterium]
MLKALFTSETRDKLINIFLLNSDNKYTIRQLSKRTGLQAAQIRKELSNLKGFGLIKLLGKDNWMVNKDFIIFPELKTLIAKAQLLSSQKFIDGLQKISNTKFLALSGIFTGDEMVKTDILIVGKIKRRLFAGLIKELENDLAKEIKYTIIDETEFFYRREVMDIFLYNILHGKTIFLIDSLTEEGIERENLKNKMESNENESSDN